MYSVGGVALTLAAARRDGAPADEDDDRARALYVAVAAVTGLAGYAAYVGFISVRTQVWYYL